MTSPMTAPMTTVEKKITLILASIYATRMLGLFLIFPTFSLLATDLTHSTPFKIGLALGIYSLAQAALQIPAGILSDIIGRKKVLYIGLSLFLLGSLLATMTDDIHWLIFARFIQGTGAVSAVCLAYVADGIRGQHHGKAMAVIGIFIALSFVASFVLGTLISAQWGLQGLFVLTSVLAALALFFAYRLPIPSQTLTVFKLTDFAKVITHKAAWFVNLQIAMLHLVLASSFFLIPLLLTQHLAGVNFILLYVPGLIVAFALVMPVIAKQKSQVAKRLPLMWAILGSGFLLFASGMGFHSIVWFSVSLTVFFFAFTFIEASLPTRLFQLVSNTSRGASSGVYAVYQFVGNFLGGILGASLYTKFDTSGTINHGFYLLAGIALLFAVTTYMMKNKEATWQAEA